MKIVTVDGWEYNYLFDTFQPINDNAARRVCLPSELFLFCCGNKSLSDEEILSISPHSHIAELKEDCNMTVSKKTISEKAFNVLRFIIGKSSRENDSVVFLNAPPGSVVTYAGRA